MQNKKKMCQLHIINPTGKECDTVINKKKPSNPLHKSKNVISASIHQAQRTEIEKYRCFGLALE